MKGEKRKDKEDGVGLVSRRAEQAKCVKVGKGGRGTAGKEYQDGQAIKSIAFVMDIQTTSPVERRRPL